MVQLRFLLITNRKVMKSVEDLQKDKLLAEIKKIEEETKHIKQTVSNEALSIKDDYVEKRKIQKEIEKLHQEVEILRQPWYHQTSFFSLIVSLLAPVMTFVVGYYALGGKAYFDAQAVRNQNRIDSIGRLFNTLNQRKLALVKDSMLLNTREKKLGNKEKGLDKRESKSDSTDKALNRKVAILNKRIIRFNKTINLINHLSKNKDSSTTSLIPLLSNLKTNLNYEAGTIPLLPVTIRGKQTNGKPLSTSFVLSPGSPAITIPYGTYELIFNGTGYKLEGAINTIKINKPDITIPIKVTQTTQ